MANFGKAFNRANKILVKALGEMVSVTRPAKIGTAAITFNLNAAITPLNSDSARSLGLEGPGNVAETNPYLFVFLADSDVRINDEISYDGSIWKVLTSDRNRVSGSNSSLPCVGVKVK